MKATIAILASGSGTTAEAFMRSMVTNDYDFTVAVVITNNPAAKVLERVARLNAELRLSVATRVINSKTHPAAPGETVTVGHQTAAEQQAILEALREYKVDVVLLLGYMKYVGEAIIEEYGWLPRYTSIYQARMLNTHPGLLPATKGLFGIYVQEAALGQTPPKAGQTLHMVSAGYDEGPILVEHPVEIVPGETAEQLFERVQKIEKAHIAADVARFIADRSDYNHRKEAK